ncbi:MAG: hypothetical protein IRY85_06040 [Micromonosporaceae bacterium]|nr:hypothetical protein [Micromonosporaceae bacterium]
MRVLLADLRYAGLGLLSRVHATIATVRRTTTAVLLLRALVFGALVVAFVVSVPSAMLWTPVAPAVAVGLALPAALFPRTRAVGFALVTIGATWLVTTTFIDLDWSAARVLGLAAALYVAHAAAAFAAVVPNDTAVNRGALLRWALRTSLVVVASVGLGAIGLAAAAWLPQAQGILAPVVGSVVAVGIVAVIVWLARRPGRVP